MAPRPDLPSNPFAIPAKPASTDSPAQTGEKPRADETTSGEEQTDKSAPTSPNANSAGAAFGLLFKAPDPKTRAPRRKPTPVPAEDSSSADKSEEQKQDDTDSGEQPRRRRRGGRGRKLRYEENANSEDKAAEENASGDDADGDDGNDDSETTTVRTRRRRRSSSDENRANKRATVKKRDGATPVKGSTRMEAKRMRRREGRAAGRRRTIITEAEFLARRESVERTMVVRERGEHTQIAVIEDGVLAEHYASRNDAAASMIGNVYLGRVQNVLPSMEAAFVDIGRGRNAVLYAGEVNWDAAGLAGKPHRIEDALQSGQSVLVQVTKDPIGHKGARLTSQVSLPGRFLVFVPGQNMMGISRRLPEAERARLKKILKEIMPENAGVIVRTAAEGASEEALNEDVTRLNKLWAKINEKAEKGRAPSLIHGEPDLTVRVIRDVFNEDFTKMVVSGKKCWSRVHDYVTDVAPELIERLEKWTGSADVFTEHRIDEQLAKAMDRKVWLPSGGSLVIDRTEAMTVVDVNTGRFVGSGGNLEETVTENNLEAAEEIVRQLRLRDIGGIIVIDFIDMVLEANRELVVHRLLECLGRDRTKHQVAEVTSLGLVQMTRKRIGAGLLEVFSETCTHCQGRGISIHTDPVALGAPESGSGRSPRRRSAKGDRQETPTSQDGLTPAQVAAAAHAAAKIMQSGDTESPQDSADQRSSSQEVAVRSDSSHEVVTTPKKRKPRRKSRKASSPATTPATAETPESQEPSADTESTEVVSTDEVAAPKSRAVRPGARRAVSAPAGASGTNAVVLAVSINAPSGAGTPASPVAAGSVKAGSGGKSSKRRAASSPSGGPEQQS